MNSSVRIFPRLWAKAASMQSLHAFQFTPHEPFWPVYRRATSRPTKIHNHGYAQFRLAQPLVHVFGQWEEAKLLQSNHANFTQKGPRMDLNPKPSFVCLFVCLFACLLCKQETQQPLSQPDFCSFHLACDFFFFFSKPRRQWHTCSRPPLPICDPF